MVMPKSSASWLYAGLIMAVLMVPSAARRQTCMRTAIFYVSAKRSLPFLHL